MRTLTRFDHRAWRIGVAALLIVKLTTFSAMTAARGDVFSSTERLWEESYEQSPENPRAILNLATAYSATHKYAEAKDLLQKLLPLQPKNGLIYSKLGFIYAQADNPQRDPERALEYYRRSFELEPNDPIALLNAAMLAIGLNRLPEADTFLKKVFQLNSEMPYAHYAVGLLEEKEGHREQAVQHLTKALQLDANFTEAQDALKRIEGAK